MHETGELYKEGPNSGRRVHSLWCVDGTWIFKNYMCMPECISLKSFRLSNWAQTHLHIGIWSPARCLRSTCHKTRVLPASPVLAAQGLHHSCSAAARRQHGHGKRVWPGSRRMPLSPLPRRRSRFRQSSEPSPPRGGAVTAVSRSADFPHMKQTHFQQQVQLNPLVFQPWLRSS